jgi:peptide chain release factor 3
MANERKVIDEAYAGDVIGVFDPGIFSIGDTITTLPDKFRFGGMPTFAPEHFASLRLVDSMKRKQFVKGVTQIAQEGAIQLFKEFSGGLGEVVVGAVGVLQFDVLKYRLESEYGVEIRLDPLPYEHIRWIENKEEDMDLYASRLNLTSDCKRVKDMHDKPLLVFIHEWSVKTVLDRNEGLILSEFGRN